MGAGAFKMEAFKQAEYRQVRTFFDQHQRPWEAVVDSRDRALTWSAPLRPMFSLPSKKLMPPPNFLKPDGLGRLRVDYDGWMQQVHGANEDWNTELMKICQAQNPNAALDTFKNPPAEILRLIGARPMPLEFIKAMKAGNNWVLGKSDREPEWLNDKLRQWLGTARTRREAVDLDDGIDYRDGDGERYMNIEDQFDPKAMGGKVVAIPKKKKSGNSAYNVFVSKMSKDGKSLKEISALWKVEKAKRAS